jgi:hypothetical protein
MVTGKSDCNDYNKGQQTSAGCVSSVVTELQTTQVFSSFDLRRNVQAVAGRKCESEIAKNTKQRNTLRKCVVYMITEAKFRIGEDDDDVF